MKLPQGWQLDSKNKTTFYEAAHRDAAFGWVTKYQLEEGQTLDQFVDELLTQSGNMEAMFRGMARVLGRFVGEEGLEEEFHQTSVVSRSSCKVGDRDAVTVVLSSDCSQFAVFINCDNSVIEVSFRTPLEEFDDYEPALRTAIKSIIIR